MLVVDPVRAQEKRVPRLVTHPSTVAFGLANLYLLDLTGPVIASDHDLLYHMTGSASSVIVPIVIYLMVLWMLLAMLFRLAESPGALRVMIWSGAVLALPPVLLHMIGNFSGEDIPDWLTILVASLCAAAFLAACFRWRRFQRRFEAMQPAAATMMGFLAFSGIFIFVQLSWNAWEARSMNAPRALHRAQLDPQPLRPRIIWLVLDELSYQQVFEARFPGLELPAFDRLAAQSTVFTHAIPAGKFTRYVLPTLFTGTPSDEIDVSAAGLLLALRDPETGKWSRFRQHQTVFQDAIDAGYRTGLAGWYNPYCRILPEVLDRCFWTYREGTPAHLSPNRTLAIDLIRPFRHLAEDIEHLLGHGPGSPSDERRDLWQHRGDYRRLLAAGDADLNDPSIDFLVLHIPVPHPYGFYDRHTKAFSTTRTSYIDSLALADVYLAHVRQILEQQKQWDSTTLVVMGDHSWRTSFIWKDSDSWTDEDEAASHGGQFDDRPAYLVKLPGQQTSARIDQPFPAVATRALLDAVMQGRIHDAADLQRWVSARK